MYKKNKIYFILVATMIIGGCGSINKPPADTQTIGASTSNPTTNPGKIDTPRGTNDSKIVLEDAEDSKTSRWIYSYGEKGEINNISDSERTGKVIALKGKVINETPATFFQFQDKTKTLGKYIQWSMKTEDRFQVHIEANTKNGPRILAYNDKDTGKGLETSSGGVKYIVHGLKSRSYDGQWHTHLRDIEKDLKRYEPNNSLISVNAIRFGGNIKVDDIFSYTSSENLRIDSTAIISAPGVVLSFDDSLIEKWSEAMEMFEKEDVQATFFCHRWAAETSAMNEQEKASLKDFQNKGHEIGFHTIHHLGAKDAKYKGTMQEKAQQYFDGEIDPGVQDMQNSGFSPSSFSYPYVSGTAVHNTKIINTLPHIREFFAHVNQIDDSQGDTVKIENIKAMLDKYKKDKEIGVFFGHWILKSNFEPANPRYKQRVSIQKLKDIISYAKEIGLKFYTLEEAHNMYLNQ